MIINMLQLKHHAKIYTRCVKRLMIIMPCSKCDHCTLIDMLLGVKWHFSPRVMFVDSAGGRRLEEVEH